MVGENIVTGQCDFCRKLSQHLRLRVCSHLWKSYCLKLVSVMTDYRYIKSNFQMLVTNVCCQIVGTVCNVGK